MRDKPFIVIALIIAGAFVFYLVGHSTLSSSYDESRSKITVDSDLIVSPDVQIVIDTIAQSDDLSAIIAENEALIAENFPELAGLPTPAQELAELEKFAEPSRHVAYSTFVTGRYFFAHKEPGLALRFFRKSTSEAETFAALTMVGLSHKELGETLAAYDVRQRLLQMAAEQGDTERAKWIEDILSRTTSNFTSMMIASIIIGSLISFSTLSGLIFFIMRHRRRRESGAVSSQWPSMRRFIFANDIKAAPQADFDRIAATIDGIGWEQCYDGKTKVTLADIRRELEKRSDLSAPHAIKVEREFLYGIFLSCLSDHRRALRHYNAAAQKADLPSIRLLIGLSFLALGRKAPARKSLEPLADGGGQIDDTVRQRAAELLESS